MRRAAIQLGLWCLPEIGGAQVLHSPKTRTWTLRDVNSSTVAFKRGALLPATVTVLRAHECVRFPAGRVPEHGVLNIFRYQHLR